MLNQAQKTLLLNNEISHLDIETILSTLSTKQIDYGDFYFQQKEVESWALEESKVKSGSYTLDNGVGIRAIAGEKTGFAYTDEISLSSIQYSAKTAQQIIKSGQSKRVQLKATTSTSNLYTRHNPLDSLSSDEKIKLLQTIDQYARKKDPRVIQVFANLVGSFETVLIAATDGTFAADIRPLVRLNISIVIEKNNEREQGTAGIGGRYPLSDLTTEAGFKLVDQAIEQALLNLDAKPAPAGQMQVVLGAGWPGVLLHEAVGHGLEADFNRKQTSVFAGMIGKQVTSPLCTIVDDGTMPKRRGSLQIDDEGVASRENVLIEDGILRGYLQDKHNAQLMGEHPTGNGRRESYAHLPMPRMTNTFMRNGSSSQAQMISEVKNGIFAVNFAGGQVDITSGKFVFTTSEAYKIEHGKIVYPIKKATLIGNGLEVMQQISMVGDDLSLDEGVGTCGKAGQSVPVGVGQPSLLVDKLVVGGTAHG